MRITTLKRYLHKGFTLIELVIVIAIIAVLVGVSVPTYFGITSYAQNVAIEAQARTAYLEYLSESYKEDTSAYLLNENSAFEGKNGNLIKRELEDFLITPEVKEERFIEGEYLPKGYSYGDIKVAYIAEKANEYFYVGTYEEFKVYAPKEIPTCEHEWFYYYLEEQSSVTKIDVIKTCLKCNEKTYCQLDRDDNYHLAKNNQNEFIYQIVHEEDEYFIYAEVLDKGQNQTTFKLDCSYRVNITPTASKGGEISYRASFLNEEIVDIRQIGKTNSYDWTWAFYNDFNADGIPELLPTTYSSKVTYKYLYKFKESDIEGYPDYNDFPYSTDEEWEELDVMYYRKMEELEPLIELYGKDSDIVKEAIAEVEQRYSDRIDELCLKDEEAEKEFQKALQAFRNTHDISDVGKITPDTTYEIEEDYTLAYWLHVPFDYNPNKEYPVVVFVPGEGGSFSDYVDAEGNVKGTSVVPYGTGWCNAWYQSWYEQVRNSGESRDKYDCFMISIYPRNKFFRGESLPGKGTAIGINSMHNVTGIEDAYTYSSEQLEGSSASYKSCYDASLLSPAKDAQLVTKLIDEMAEIYSIDLNRQYLLGASLGGIFTMDTISHYPDRFAAAVPVVSASADISESNCKYLTNMNIWAISGTGDGNCSRFHSKLFVNSINECREKYHISNNNVAQYSFFPGGHSCGYIGSSLRNATEGVSITYGTQVLDFLFNSSK